MTASPTLQPTERVALFERAAEYLLDRLTDATDAGLGDPTPCPGWDLRTLVEHVADVADGLTGLIATGTLNMPATPRQVADPVADAQERARHLVETMSTATGDRAITDDDADVTEWVEQAAQAGVIEFTAHGWDVATACGDREPIPADLAMDVLELATSLIDDSIRLSNFGPAFELDPTATPSDRLIAFLGRHPA